VPFGKEPDNKEYVTVSPSASVADTVTLWFPSAIVMPDKAPALVCQTGFVSTLINPDADVPANPLVEVTLTL